MCTYTVWQPEWLSFVYWTFNNRFTFDRLPYNEDGCDFLHLTAHAKSFSKKVLALTGIDTFKLSIKDIQMFLCTFIPYKCKKVRVSIWRTCINPQGCVKSGGSELQMEVVQVWCFLFSVPLYFFPRLGSRAVARDAGSQGPTGEIVIWTIWHLSKQPS